MDKLLKILGIIALVWLAIWAFGFIAGFLFKVLIIVVLAALILWVVRTMIRN